MTKLHDIADPIARYHDELPPRIRGYMHSRGIPDLLIDTHQFGWDGRRITIPIFNRAGELAFFKLARDPEDVERPKMIAPRGSHAELYGWDQVLKRPAQIVICEGEFDRLVLEAQGFTAVTSTGGAGVFRPEWAAEFDAIPEVYVCFDRDDAGRRGAERVGMMIPHARVIELPEEVGPGGDVTDFFVRLGKNREDFERLMEAAMPVPPATPAPLPRPRSISPERERIERIKREHPITEAVGRYIQLRPQGRSMVGRCPFHDDRNPSLVVFPETGTFHCFGCGNHGDIISFVREVERIGFSEALNWLERNPPIAPEVTT